MGDIEEFSQLCRLCLVKEEVNVPIFDESSDIRQTFLKISSCLPVKVSPEDNLPKKICDGCSYKLDMLYVFRNTSVDSEKQLLSWLDQAGLDGETVKDGLGAKAEVMVKQEAFEPIDTRIEDGEEGSDIGVDAQSYIIQQQQLSYEQDFSYGEEDEPTDPTVDPIATDEPAPKRAKRNASKRPVLDETEDELDSALHITKAEDDDEDVDQHDYLEATEAPSTSADDQPGPSGVGKGTVEAPSAMEIIIQDSPQSCPICSRKFYSKRGISRHIVRHREKTIQCPLCPKKFVSAGERKQHVRCVHDKLRPYVCHFCNQTYTTRKALDYHIASSHTKDFPFKCNVCGAGFMDRLLLENHRLVNHEGLRFRCKSCEKSFKSYAYLKTHEKRHDPNFFRAAYTCEICRKVMHIKRNFERHMRIHNNEEAFYVCDVCGKSVTTLESFKDHKKIHLGEKNYVCDVCGKAFVTKQNLITHSRVHTKEKPFKCNVCNKCFTQKSTLNIHMRYHTGERPYKCHLCAKDFVSRTLLKCHKCR